MWKDAILAQPVAPYDERRRRIEAEPLPENIGALIDEAAAAAGDRDCCGALSTAARRSPTTACAGR
jgi:hypothetical protein